MLDAHLAQQGGRPTAEGVAHGRINLVGEHTDYNDGLVLPTLIPQQAVVSLSARDDRAFSVSSDATGMRDIHGALDALSPRGDWSDHIIGVADLLIRHGQRIVGFDAQLRSNIPIGAGLSSSAAIAVAMARALRDAFALDIDDEEIALVAHESEDRFVGAHVGLMDQLVCSLGRAGEALLIDLRERSTRRVPLVELDAEFAVIDSGIRHQHSTGSYNTRRRECEGAARALGVRTLRDVVVERDLHGLPPVLARRVHHVVSENARVVAAVEAIERGDAAALGMIINASHASLRDDYEVSLPEIDAIIATAQHEADVYGARLIGGGFGGSVLVLTRRGAARGVARRIASGDGRLRVVLPA